MLDEASFEKMGAIMSTNNNKLLGLYDEMSTFLAQINIYRAYLNLMIFLHSCLSIMGSHGAVPQVMVNAKFSDLYVYSSVG